MINGNLKRIGFLGDYLPRQCGIATFTHDLYNAISSLNSETECFVLPVNDNEKGYDYPKEVRFEFSEKDLAAYQKAADFLNFRNTDVVSLQHEFGIYGGPEGNYIIALLSNLRIPIVTTMHTVLNKPNPNQFHVVKKLDELSARIVVMSEKGKSFLKNIYNVSENKIDVIPHGIPDMPFVDPNFYKDQFGVEGKFVLLTFGLLSPNKGIEYVLKALPKIISKYPDVVYIILGATHPKVIKEEGETYRLFLERLANDLGIKKNVIFYNRFVESDELTAFIGASDIYITPYLNKKQITSGTLSYAFGCGKAVISTPYWHAEELLAEGNGLLVPFNDNDAISDEVMNLLEDEPRRHAIRKKAYNVGRDMIWSNAAQLYNKSFLDAREIYLDAKSYPLKIKTLEEQSVGLPQIQLQHLRTMTDSTGLLQHARYVFPNYEDGYCTDDNARSLILTVLLEEIGQDISGVDSLKSIYAAFLNHAFDPKKKCFRNFMGFDRRWLEKAGSDDSQSRAIWALGTCVGRSKNKKLQMWAAQIFNQAITIATKLRYARSWAFSLLGIHEYFRALSGDRLVNEIRTKLIEMLIEQYNKNSSDDWPWFEESVTYENAKIPHALILSGRWADNNEALEIGLRSLRWLTELQTTEEGHFRPIGSSGFYPKGGTRANYDQQPVEAYATVSACIEAYRVNDEQYWLDQAKMAFDWFLGKNDLGLQLFDSQTGGCSDAVQVDRLNQNQGAESTLAYLLSLSEMQILENSFKILKHPSKNDEVQPLII